MGEHKIGNGEMFGSTNRWRYVITCTCEAVCEGGPARSELEAIDQAHSRWVTHSERRLTYP